MFFPPGADPFGSAAVTHLRVRRGNGGSVPSFPLAAGSGRGHRGADLGHWKWMPCSPAGCRFRCFLLSCDVLLLKPI